MHELYDTYRPEGFGSVTAYLSVDKPVELIDFLKNVFYAEEITRTVNQTNGIILNAILKIGVTCFMISQTTDDCPDFHNMRTRLYVLVNNVDDTHKRAIEFGGKVEYEPEDQPWQDRNSGIIDPCGNYWYISKRLVEKQYE